jgi:outer membrane protein TolC
VSSLARSSTLGGQLSGTLPTSTQYALALQSHLHSLSPNSPIGPDGSDNTLVVSLTQPLLRGFGAAGGAAQVESARLGYRASQARFARLLEETIAAVEVSYWTLAQREAEEAVAAQSLQRALLLLNRNEELRKLDKINEVDLQTSRLGVASRQNTLLQATLARQNAADALVFLAYGADALTRLGTLDASIRTASQPVEAQLAFMRIPPLAASESLALGRRSDLLAVHKELEQQRRLVDIARNALLPSVGLTGSYTALTKNSDSFRLSAARLGEAQSAGWSAGLVFSLPLGNSRARAIFEQQNSLFAQDLIAVTATGNVVRGDIRRAHRGISIGTQALATAEQASSLARAQFDGESKRLELGLSESFRLLQYEEQLANAQFAETAARYSLASAITRYQLALGGELGAKYGMSGGEAPPR